LEAVLLCEDFDPAAKIRPALGNGTTFCRTALLVGEGRMAVSVTDRRRSNRLAKEVTMEIQIQRGCGLDVHQATIVACLLIVLADGKVKKQMRRSGTTTRELLALGDWLQGEGCTHVAMESTGVYWKPVYAILEGAFEIIVANAQRIKNVPGRKADVKDAEWIADLLLNGLLKASFVPPKPIRELRDLTRYGRKLVESRSDERNRLQKVLETANIKLASVASDVFGVSGMQMLEALAEGEATPARWPSWPGDGCGQVCRSRRSKLSNSTRLCAWAAQISLAGSLHKSRTSSTCLGAPRWATICGCPRWLDREPPSAVSSTGTLPSCTWEPGTIAAWQWPSIKWPASWRRRRVF
jgi:hypothetical protein